MIAGFLTVIGYSLNDTIVVFDRIRENRGKLATLSANIINNSINQTLSRTILTSFTTLIVLEMAFDGEEELMVIRRGCLRLRSLGIHQTPPLPPVVASWWRSGLC